MKDNVLQNATQTCKGQPLESQEFQIADPVWTVKKGDQTKATRTSMHIGAIISGTKTDIRGHNSRVYL